MNWKQAFALGLCSVGEYVESWKTLFEGTVTTDGTAGNGTPYSSVDTCVPMSDGDTLRITVDGVSKLHTVVYIKNSGWYVGNRYLLGSSEVDDGGDFMMRRSDAWGIINASTMYFRTEGTYTVKIESAKRIEMCKYNSVVLPKISPIEGYPYMTLVSRFDSIGYDTNLCPAYYVYFTKTPALKACDYDPELEYCLKPTGTDVIDKQYDARVLTDWWSSELSSNLDWLYGLPLWANYDILDTDGNLYLAASDPVPVYA